MNKKARIITIAVVSVLLLPVLLLVEENWRGKRVWENTKRELEAQGEHLELAQLLPPPIPDDQNFALNPVFAPLYTDPEHPKFGHADANGNSVPSSDVRLEVVFDIKADYPIPKGSWSTGQPRDLEVWQKYYREVLKNVTLDKSPAEDVLTALSRYDPIFAGLREAEKTRPLSRPPMDYSLGVATSIPQYSPMQKLIGILSMRASAEIQLNRPADALADIELGLHLLDSIKDDPLVITGLIRLTWLAMLMQPMWDGIAAHCWTDAQLRELESRLRYNWMDDYLRTMRTERAAMNITWENHRKNRIPLRDNDSFDDKVTKFVIAHSRYFPGFLYQNQASENRLMQEVMLPLVDAPARRVRLRQAKLAQDYLNNPKNFSLYSVYSQPSLSTFINILVKYAQVQADANLAIVACEIERYRLAHGRLPVTLDDLGAPDLPRDVIDGGPLHYQVSGDDYLLYSIGWNGVDDGGKVVRKKDSKAVDNREGDWVWSSKPL